MYTISITFKDEGEDVEIDEKNVNNVDEIVNYFEDYLSDFMPPFKLRIRHVDNEIKIKSTNDDYEKIIKQIIESWKEPSTDDEGI